MESLDPVRGQPEEGVETCVTAGSSNGGVGIGRVKEIAVATAGYLSEEIQTWEVWEDKRLKAWTSKSLRGRLILSKNI